MSVYPRGNGRFVVQVYDRHLHKTVQVGTFATRAEALKAEQGAKDEVRRRGTVVRRRKWSPVELVAASDERADAMAAFIGQELAACGFDVTIDVPILRIEFADGPPVAVGVVRDG